MESLLCIMKSCAKGSYLVHRQLFQTLRWMPTSAQLTWRGMTHPGYLPCPELIAHLLKLSSRTKATQAACTHLTSSFILHNYMSTLPHFPRWTQVHFLTIPRLWVMPDAHVQRESQPPSDSSSECQANWITAGNLVLLKLCFGLKAIPCNVPCTIRTYICM